MEWPSASLGASPANGRTRTIWAKSILSTPALCRWWNRCVCSPCEGLAETATLGRLTALHRQGVFDDDSREKLAAAFHHITSLLLRQQIRDFHTGRKVSNYVHPASRNLRERADVVETLDRKSTRLNSSH